MSEDDYPRAERLASRLDLRGDIFFRYYEEIFKRPYLFKYGWHRFHHDTSDANCTRRSNENHCALGGRSASHRAAAAALLSPSTWAGTASTTFFFGAIRFFAGFAVAFEAGFAAVRGTTFAVGFLVFISSSSDSSSLTLLSIFASLFFVRVSLAFSFFFFI